MPDHVYVECVNCGKQTLVESDDPPDVKCEFCRKPARIKVKEVSKVQNNPTIKSNIEKLGEAIRTPLPPSPPPAAEDSHPTPESYVGKPHAPRGKLKWAKRCKNCENSYDHDEKTHCSSKHCSQHCPRDFRPPYRPYDMPEDNNTTEVPPRPSKYKELPAYFEKHKEAILQDYNTLRYKIFLKKWHLTFGMVKKLFDKWEVVFKGRTRDQKKKRDKSHAPEQVCLKMPGSTLPYITLPPLPTFSDNWSPMVQIAWFEARVKLMELDNERFHYEIQAGIHGDRIREENMISAIETIQKLQSAPKRGGWISRLFSKKGG